LRTSMRWISALDLALDAPILDVGGGASWLTFIGYMKDRTSTPKWVS